MKSIIVVIMLGISISGFVYGQYRPDENKNVTELIKRLQIDEDNLYSLKEAQKIKVEAGKWLTEANKLSVDVADIKKIAQASSRFEDLKEKAIKKAEKLEYDALAKKLDVLEYYELANDLTYFVYRNTFEHVFPDVSNMEIHKGNKLLKEAASLWNSAKELRNMGYTEGLTLKGLEILVEAQKLEDEAISKQEMGLSVLLAYDYTPNNDVNYEMLSQNTTEVAVIEEKLKPMDKIELNGINNSSIESLTFAQKCKNDKPNLASVNNKRITYKIQIGAFLGKAEETAFRGINPITVEKSERGFTRYLAGDYNSYEVACHALKVLMETSFKDAFIVTYVDNIRLGPGISMPISNMAKK